MTKADRTVSAFLQRLDDFHLHGGPDAFVKICRDICSGPLEGSNAEFTVLWEKLVDEDKKMASCLTTLPCQKAKKHIFGEKDRKAPPIEAAPALKRVRLHRR